MVDVNKCANYEIARQCFNEELAFRIRCRRNRLLGLWAAAELGMLGEEADAHARSIVALGIEYSDDRALVDHIARDKRASGAPCLEHAVRAEMDRLWNIASMEYAASEPSRQPKAA
jgi:hypothetical protein